MDTPRPPTLERPTSARLTSLASASFALATVAMMVKELVELFSSTRAAPPEEFPASAVLFSFYRPAIVALPVLTGIFVLLAIAAIASEWRRHAALGRARVAGDIAVFVGWAVASAGQIAANWHGAWALVAGSGLFVAYLAGEAQRLDDGAAKTELAAAAGVLAALGPGRVARAGAEVIGLPAAGFVVAVAAELVLHTRTFAGAVFETSDLWRFAALGLSAAGIAGARFGVELSLILLVAAEVIRPRTTPWPRGRLVLFSAAAFSLTTSSTWSLSGVATLVAVVAGLAVWLRPRGAPGPRHLLALPLLTGLYVWARMRDFFLSTLGDEVAALGIEWMVHTLFGLFALLVALWTHRGLVALFAVRPPRGGFDVVAALAVAWAPRASPPRASPPPKAAVRSPLPSRVREQPPYPLRTRQTLPALALLAAVVVLLVEVDYPHFVDFSLRVQRLWSTALGLVVFLLLLVLYVMGGRRFLRRPPARWAVGAAVALGALGYAALHDLHVARMIGAQYSRIARTVIELASIVPEAPLFGLGEDDAPPELLAAPGPVLPATPPFPVLTATRARGDRRPLIVLILLDGARPDHLGLYGYGRDTTPALGRIARDGVLFERAYANATATTTSLRHLFTGRYSSRYMLAKGHAPFFTGDLVALGYDRIFANILGTDFNGVSLAAFTRNHPPAIAAAVEAATIELRTYDEPAKVKDAIALLDAELARRAGRPHPADGLFFFLHCTAPHHPWRNHDDHPTYGEEPVDRYDNSIGHADRAMGAFLDHLVRRGIYDDAIVVVTADHGTGLGEHGRLGGFHPYEEQIRVPLVIKAPGFAPHRVAAPVAAIDLAPTLLSLLRPGAPNPYDGSSLAALMEGSGSPPPRRYLFALNAFEDSMAVLDLETGLKLHVHRTERYTMLFDLRADPGERSNLADARPDLAAPLLALVRRWSWSGRTSWGNPWNYRPLTLE